MLETTTRPPAVAGTFYPGDPEALRREVRALLDDAHATGDDRPLKALIAPHAGYVYSGPVAATAYARLRRLAGRIRRVVLLGPTHRVAIRGLALPGATWFATPLGNVEIDSDAIALLSSLPQVIDSPQAHALEHSLEVHLPFLQETLGSFRLVPLAVGDASPEAVADVLERLWGGDDTLIVVSSDLSHYLPYPEARRTDKETVQDMLALSPRIDHHHACGATPVNGLLLVAARRGLKPTLLDLRNSGDTAGDKSRVVGYASIAFTEGGGPPVRAGDDKGPTLLRIARAAIGRQLGLSMTAPEHAPYLREDAATFVTLTRDGDLRGCIGTLEAHQPLVDDVKKNARSAAFLDPRFRPLSLREFDAILVEVSLLAPARPLRFKDQEDLLAQLNPGVDGLILEAEGRRGTFLTQVWESLPSPTEFLSHLKQKAGLPAHYWSDRLSVARYTVEKWSEAR